MCDNNNYPVKRSNNLEFTRFIAAILVIYSHSFVLTSGNKDTEGLYYITNGQLDFGALAVAVFFLCGGFLTMRGMERVDGIFSYIKKRLFRILPVLWVVVITCIIVGAFISTYSFSEYFADSRTYRYLLNGIMIPQHELPGVFQGAVYCPTVNGALWTLPVEFACNIACVIGLKIGLLNKKYLKFTIPIVFTMAIIFYIVTAGQPVMRDIARPCILFYVGMILYAYGDKIKWSPVIALAMAVVLVISSVCDLLFFGMITAFPYISIYLWFYVKQGFRNTSKLGRYTYAMYLWAFPLQQLVAMCYDWKVSSYTDAGITIVASMILAVISYHLVEVNVSKKMRKG